MFKRFYSQEIDAISMDDKVTVKWKPMGRLPNWTSSGLGYKDIRRMNRYIAYQESRILKLCEGEYKEPEKAIFLWRILLKNSMSYQTLLFVKSCREYYWKFDEGFVMKTFRKWVNKCRRDDMKIFMKRFYIPKKNGKLRPIGAPTWTSKAHSIAISHLCYMILDDFLVPNQFGFRRNRGAFDALEVVLDGLRTGYQFMQFDLEKFFNKVNLKGLMGMLEWQVCKSFADLIATSVARTSCLITEYHEEEEYKNPISLMKYSGRLYKLYIRGGFPQGLSYSPILSTFALEYGMPRRLIMYADDGLYAYDDINQLQDLVGWAGVMRHFGAHMKDLEKCTDKFKFLGVEFDIIKETMSFKDSTIKWDNERAVHWLKTIGNKYGKQSPDWSWDMHSRSISQGFPLVYIKESWRTILFRMKIMWYGQHKGYKYIPGFGIFNISGLSTQSCNELIRKSKQLKYTKKKGLSELLSHRSTDLRNAYCYERTKLLVTEN